MEPRLNYLQTAAASPTLLYNMQICIPAMSTSKSAGVARRLSQKSFAALALKSAINLVPHSKPHLDHLTGLSEVWQKDIATNLQICLCFCPCQQLSFSPTGPSTFPLCTGLFVTARVALWDGEARLVCKPDVAMACSQQRLRTHTLLRS